MKKAGGFTLIEMLVVIAIVGILLSLLMPAVQMARESARRSACAANLRQMGAALHGYHDLRGAFPIGCVARKTRRIAWSVYLLPLIEEQNAWEAFDTRFSYRSAENRRATSQIIPLYLCPSTVRRAWDRDGDTSGDANKNGQYDPGDWMGMIDYGGMFGAAHVEPFMNGVLVWDKAIRIRDIRDGTSSTILVAEDSGRGSSMDGQWANGENIFDVAGPINAEQDNEMWSDHPGGAQALLCDGSVHFLNESLPLDVLNKLCTRDGGEVVRERDYSN